MSGCAITDVVHQRDGREYGVIQGAFRGRWYNYYERGLSYADGGYWTEALADFIAARDLRDKDQRRARTYGLHFIDYFPNREIGVAHLQLGEIDAAIAALETSLEQIDTGRAEYFLNEARRQQIALSGVVDQEPPAIDLGSLADGLVRTPQLALQGSISDPSRVRAVRVNDAPVLLPVAVSVVELEQAIALGAGVNEIRIEAEDLFGNLATAVLRVELDEQPPAIVVTDLRDEPEGRFFHGTAEDASGIAALLAGGAAQPIEPAPRVSFRVAAAGELVIRAEDRAGNVTEVELDPERFAARLAAADAAPPSVELSDVPATVYEDRVFIDGVVRDRGRVESLTLAGESVPVGTGQPTVYFRRVVHLEPGANVLELVATDDGGRSTRESLTITRRVPPEQAVETRLSVTVAPLVPVGEADAGTREAVEQNLENALVEQRRFHVMDTSRVSALVTEWQLVATDLAEDGPDLLRLGETLGSDVTLMGWLRETGGAIEVYGRIVDTSTEAILVEKDVFHERASLRTVRDLLYGLALKLKAALPRLEGELTRADGEELSLQLQDVALLPAGARLVLIAGDGEGRAAVGEARLNAPSAEGAGPAATLISGTAPAGAQVLVK